MVKGGVPEGWIVAVHWSEVEGFNSQAFIDWKGT